MSYSTPFTQRIGNKLLIEIELPACGELSRSGRAENLVDPTVWYDYEDDREFLGIKMTVCRPLSYRSAASKR